MVITPNKPKKTNKPNKPKKTKKTKKPTNLKKPTKPTGQKNYAYQLLIKKLKINY